MRVAKANFVGGRFSGFVASDGDLIVADRLTDKVRRVRGDLAVYAIDLAECAGGDERMLDAVLENLPGSVWKSPKAAGMALDDDCSVVVFK